MTRTEKFMHTLVNLRKEKERPKPDPSILRFLSRRQEQALQPRFWSKLGHALPKSRKIAHKEMSCT